MSIEVKLRFNQNFESVKPRSYKIINKKRARNLIKGDPNGVLCLSCYFQGNQQQVIYFIPLVFGVRSENIVSTILC
ncbi:hypothetical protein V6N13_043273 [Hibiscus sabdariffa]